MRKPVAVVVVVVIGLLGRSALAQEVDARAALQASMKAMGGENLKTVEYSGAGFTSLIGQQYGVEGGWPTIEIADYTRAIDYDAKWSREDSTRRLGNSPTFGRVPLRLGRARQHAGAADAPIPRWRPVR